MRLVARIMEWIPFILFFALLHAATTCVFICGAFLRHDGATGRAWEWIAKVLVEPLFYVNDRLGNPLDGFWLLIPNGLIWGLVMVLLGEWFVRPRAQQPGARGFPIRSNKQLEQSENSN